MWSQIYLSERGCNCWVLLQLKELADEVLFCETQRLQLAEDLLKDLQRDTPSVWPPNTKQHVNTQLIYLNLCISGSVTLSNLVLSATSRSEADMLPMSSSEEDWERRLLEPCTVSLFRLEVEPVNFPELPWRPETAQQIQRDLILLGRMWLSFGYHSNCRLMSANYDIKKEYSNHHKLHGYQWLAFVGIYHRIR